VPERKELTGPNGLKFWVHGDGVIHALGSKGQLYKIDPDEMTCACPSFQYSKDPQSCKHIRDAEALKIGE